MSRTITTAERGYTQGLRPQSYGKLEITDSTGAWVDVSTGLRNIDWLNALTLEENIDQSTWRLSGSLLRNAGTLSLAPFRSDSLINLPGGSYATMLDLWRKWRASVAVMAPGYVPTSTDWKELAQGRIDIIDVQDSPPAIQIIGRGEEAVLLDKWIPTERQYGSVGGIAMETVIQSMLDDNLGAGVVTLYTPVSPGYNMNVWTQQKGNLFPALQAVAEKAGFVLRYRYDASNVFRFTLYKPNRTATVEDWAIGPSEYIAVPLNRIDISGVRNFIKLRFVDPTLGTQTVIYPHMAGTGTVTCAAGAATFSSSQAGVLKNGSEIIVAGIPYTVSAFSGTTTCTLLSQLATGGVPTFGASAFTAHDTLSGAGFTTSLSRFGRRDMEVDLSFTTQVNSGTKAQGMCDAIGGDLEFPNLEQQFEGIGWWFIQVHDYGRFYANGTHYDTDQYGGVTSITHLISQATVKSTVGARGKPSGAYINWRFLGDATAPSGATAQQALRDTQPISMKVVRVSEAADNLVVRVSAITPNGGGTVSIAYDGGGLSVSPASPQTITATADFATTGTKDFTITRDTQGGTPRRVAFAGTMTGYVDGTDGVDVPPNSSRNRANLIPTGTGSQATGTTPTQITIWTEGSGGTDVGGLHSDSVNPSRITIPTGAGGRPWIFTASVGFQFDATGDRYVAIYKNGSSARIVCLPSTKTASNTTVIPIYFFDPSPSVGDYYEVFIWQNSGSTLSISSGSTETNFAACDLFA